MTPRQYATFTALARFLEEKGYCPSYKVLGTLINASPQSAHEITEKLIERGLVQKDPYIHCSLHLTEAGKIKWQEIRK